MSILLNEFQKDIESAISSIKFISSWDPIPSLDESELKPIEGTKSHSLITDLKRDYVAFRIDQNIIRGGLILFVTGRFEVYVKDQVEDICSRLVTKAGKFDRLPKNLKQSLVTYTGQVIQNPRKFCHGEKGAENFILTMASNLSPSEKFEKVNSECVVVTDTNLRPDVISELFNRIGAENVLDKCASQAAVQIFFHSDQLDKVVRELKLKMNKLIDLRNSIAHPTSSFTWPSKDDILDNVNFLKVFAKSIDDVSEIYVSILCN